MERDYNFWVYFMQHFLNPIVLPHWGIIPPMSNTETLFDRVVSLRKERGEDITQVAIAKDLGFSQTSVAKWKTGGGTHRRHLLKLAVKYGVCMNWLESGTPPKWAGKPGTPRGKLYSQLDQMTEEEVRDILAIWEWKSRQQDPE